MADDDYIVNKYRKKRLIAFVSFIGIFVVFCIIIGLVFILSYRQPKNLQETTGTIAEVKQHDKEWYDDIYGGTGAYLKIWLTDERYFEATGISYDNIDRELFENISVGEEITITYTSKPGGLNRIYAIEYNGVNYMLKGDVLDDFEDTSKTMTIVGAIIIAVSVIVGNVLLSIVCYKYKKKRL